MRTKPDIHVDKTHDEACFQDDQTYETQSRIAFVASRFENGELITCEANNPVLEAHNEEPERASVTVQVKCECAYHICQL